MNEVWRDVVGYEGLYQVSNFGRVKRLSAENIVIRFDGKVIKRNNVEKIYKNFDDFVCSYGVDGCSCILANDENCSRKRHSTSCCGRNLLYYRYNFL